MSTESAQQNNHGVQPGAVLRLPRIGRRIRVPLWAVLVVLGWLSFVGLCELIIPADADAPTLCRLKAVTGLPCPTCGTTRAVKTAATGDLLGAWLMNPFVVTSFVIGGLWLLWRFTTGRAFLLQLRPKVRYMLWSTIGLLFALNWLYLILNGR